jgi:Concanavalin A-like lectin/glucanases superfamily
MLIMLLLFLLLPSIAYTEPVTVQQIPLNDINTTGQAITSCWGGLGKDGSNRIYIGMGIGSPNSTDVAIFRYNASTGQRELLDTLKHVTQLEGNFDSNETFAKVHTEMLLLNGKLYFASHDFHDTAPGYHRGGHFFSYDPAANHFEDLSKTDPGGVSAPGEGIIGMDIMLPQQKLIGFTYKPDDGGNVMAYDLALHTSVYWPGNPNPDSGVSRHIFTDHTNNAYISYGQDVGPQQIYAMNVTNGAITAPAGLTLRRAQIPAVAHAADGERVFILNWDWLYLWHADTKQWEDLGSALPVADQGRSLDSASISLSRDETTLYIESEGYLDGNGPYTWHLYAFDIASRQSRLVADLATQMMAINGGSTGGMLGARVDDQGSIYTCGFAGYLLKISIQSASPPRIQLTFEECGGTTLFDERKNGNTGTLQTSPTVPTFEFGRLGRCGLHFHGQEDTVSLTMPDLASHFTIALSLKADDPIDGVQTTIPFYAPYTTGDAVTLYWNQTNVNFRQTFAMVSNGAYTLCKYVSALSASVWYRLLMTYDGTTLRCYLNGVLEASIATGFPQGSMSGAWLSPPSTITGGPASFDWRGMLDEFIIDDHTYTQTEVTSDYNRVTNPPPEGPLGR